MPIPLFTNNAATALAVAITPTDTVLQITAGTGSYFPSPTGGDYFMLTLIQINNPEVSEIVKCTLRVGDYLTVIRGQESTQPQIFNISDNVELRITASSLNLFSNDTQAANINFNPYGFVTATNVQDAVDQTIDKITSNSTALASFSGSSLVGYNQGSSEAVTQTVQSKLQQIVNVDDFGATGDGVTNDAPAIQAAINYCRSFASTGFLPRLVFGDNGAGKSYYVNTTLDFTQVRDVEWIVDFNGCQIAGASVNFPVIDALDSEFISFRNGIIYGVPTQLPTIGIQIGRGKIGNDVANSSLYNMSFNGNFSYTAFLNAGAEVFLAEKCLFWNSAAVAGAAHCLVHDSNNTSNVQSSFFTVTVPTNTQQSLNDCLYLNCTFEQIGGLGATGGAAIYVPSNTNSLRFDTCYAQNANNLVMDIAGVQSLLEFDCHCEPASVTNNIRVLCTSAPAQFFDARIKEYFMFATNALITTDGGSQLVEFINCEIEVTNSYATGKIFTNAGATINYGGTLKIGTSGYLYDLSQLNAIEGTIQCQNVLSNLTLPFINNCTIQSFDSSETQYTGKHLFSGSLLLPAGFPGTITSAATINIPQNGFQFLVSGTTNINKINVNAGDSGRLVFLIFQGALTLSNNYANGTVLAGSYATQANYAITLYCNGSAWIEISRSNNVVA